MDSKQIGAQQPEPWRAKNVIEAKDRHKSAQWGRERVDGGFWGVKISGGTIVYLPSQVDVQG